MHFASLRGPKTFFLLCIATVRSLFGSATLCKLINVLYSYPEIGKQMMLWLMVMTNFREKIIVPVLRTQYVSYLIFLHLHDIGFVELSIIACYSIFVLTTS